MITRGRRHSAHWCAARYTHRYRRRDQIRDRFIESNFREGFEVSRLTRKLPTSAR